MTIEVPTITVIIPMYNAAKYIEQAVDSALNQTFKDIEVLIINDGSTDGSYELVRACYGDNPRVRLIDNRKNMGSALTRNTGIRSATGKYVALLDADDVYLPTMLETLYATAEHHQSDVVSSIGYLLSNGENISQNFSEQFRAVSECTPSQDAIAPPDNFHERVEAYLRGEFGFCVCWNKLYRRKFLLDNNIFYPRTVEDRGFVLKCVLCAEKFVKVPKFFNIYRNGIQSQSRKPPTLERLSQSVKTMAGFVSDLEEIMSDFDFFNDNPVYKYRVIERHLCALDEAALIGYYLDGRAIDAAVIKTVGEAADKIFGDRSQMVAWLFHRYHVFYRQNLELIARLRQLESQRK